MGDFFFICFYVSNCYNAAILFFWVENGKLCSGMLESAYTGSRANC